MKRAVGRRWSMVLLAVFVGWAWIVRVPAALSFPHHATFGTTTVLAERPLGPAMGRVLTRADRLVAASPLARSGVTRTIVLTQGGWRWWVLAARSSNAFGIRRPFGSVLAFNRSDIGVDRVWNGRAVAGERTLSGTIAHETTHLLVAAHLGEWRTAMLPQWVAEGYPDYVAGESSLSDAAAARARAAGENPPALAYYDARRRVAAVLRTHGGDVNALYR